MPVPEDGALPWPEADAWAHAVAASPLVAAGALRWEHDLLYLDRYWQQEVQVCADLVARRGLPPPSVDVAVLDAGVQRVFPDDGYDEQRAAVLLVGLEEMSYEDAARVLGIPIGTLMSRLSRGREHLRRLMDGEGRPRIRRVK